MAKKRKKEKPVEEKYEFIPPEFDEKQFLKDEILATKRVVLIVLYGILFGALAAAVTAMTRNGYLGVLVFILGAVAIRYFLIATKFDLSKFTRRIWAENAVWYFFTFLAIWILAVNPPFFDSIEPEIKNVRVSVEVQGKFIVYNYSKDTHEWLTSKGNLSIKNALASACANHTHVNISAQIADGSGLNGSPVIALAPNTPIESGMSAAAGSRYYYLIESMDTNYLNNGKYFTFSITAKDPYNNRASFSLPTSAEVVVG